ncbi:MAG TPA: DUF2336 domain-containing protein [Candidatus Acidoferrum sp.]|nr:DUF2336 domain-containing protein [Candidatus Acidoferrum sp.]
MMSTSDDIRYLIGLARDKSVESRKRLVAVVSDIFFSDQAILTEYERALITDILHKLIYELAVPVREVLSAHLGRDEATPRAVLRALAEDEIEIAAPILLNNEALLDVELIEVVRHRALEHQLMLAMRRAPLATAADPALEAGDGDLVQELLDSGDNKLVDATMAYLIDQTRGLDSFQEPILRREDLSERLAKKMVLWVLAALRQHILDRFEVDLTALDDGIEAAAEDMGDRLSAERERRRGDRAVELAAALANAGRLTPARLIQAMRQGEVSLFTAMLAHLTGLRLPLVRRLLFEPGGEGLVVACRALGFDKTILASIFLLCRRARPGDWAADPRELSRVLALFDRVQPAAAHAVLARWRRDPDFLYAIKTVEEAKIDAAAV